MRRLIYPDGSPFSQAQQQEFASKDIKYVTDLELYFALRLIVGNFLPHRILRRVMYDADL